MARPKRGPAAKTFSAYAARQVKRFLADGFKLPEIAQRMGLTQHDVRTLAKTEHVKALPPSDLPRFELVSVQPVNDSGRMYSLAPRRRKEDQGRDAGEAR